MKLKFLLTLALPLLCTLALAQQPAQPAAASQPEQQSQAVFVVGPSDQPAAATGVHIDVPTMTAPVAVPGKSDKPIQVWGGPVPLAGVLWVLVASMPVFAILYFGYQIFLFFQGRRRKLIVRRD